MRISFPVLLLVALIALVPATRGEGAIRVEQVQGQAPVGSVEILGVGAGAFDPALWEANRLHWVPDVRMPLLAPRQGGLFRNIYAPSVTEEPEGWRLFYGGWDGVPTGNDRIYSVTTRDFIDFDAHTTVIEHGDFVHVCNVNVQKAADGSYHMVCTAYPDPRNLNKPIYFSSPDGRVWDGTPAPHSARLSELMEVKGYESYAQGDLNGGNVLLRDGNRWVLYFFNWKDPFKTYRAEGKSLRSFAFRGTALEPSGVVNDVKKLRADGQAWYLMGLHQNVDTLWYSLSRDGARFDVQKTLFKNLGPADRHIVAVGFVCRGNRVLGVLYGAGPVPELNRNALFARWLQKKVTLTDREGAKLEAEGALGPDRQHFRLPGGKPFEGTLTVLAEDGITVLATQPVKLDPGGVYRLVAQ